MSDVWTTKTLDGLISNSLKNKVNSLFDTYSKGLNVYSKVKFIVDSKVGLVTDLVDELDDFKNQLLATGFSVIFLDAETTPSGSWVDRLISATNSPIIDSGMHSAGVCIIFQGANSAECVTKATALKNLFKVV